MWLCGKSNNKILGPMLRKDVEPFSWLLCALRSPVLVTTTAEEREKSHDVSKSL